MTTTVTDTAEVELAIGGMTCASCAARIEKKLNRMDRAQATVNYATEKAKVTYGGGVAVDDLIATVEATGYTTAPPVPVRTGRRDRWRRDGHLDVHRDLGCVPLAPVGALLRSCRHARHDPRLRADAVLRSLHPQAGLNNHRPLPGFYALASIVLPAHPRRAQYPTG